MKKNILFIVLIFVFCTFIRVPVNAAPSISAKKADIKAGNKKKLKIKGAKGKVTWKSSNKNVAVVSKKGIVKTKKAGSVTITASFRYKGKKRKLSCGLKVYSMNTKALTIKKGSIVSMDIKGTKKEKWKSSNPKIAAISSTGKVRGIKNGSCTITGTINNIKFKRKIKVTGIKKESRTLSTTPAINVKEVEIKAGSKKQLKIKGVKGKITWKTNKDNVATVNKEGIVQTKKAGSVWIAAYFRHNGKKKKLACLLRAYSMDTDTITIKKGSTVSMDVLGTNKEKWNSSNPLVATVSSTGKVRGLQTGSCTITGTINNITFKRNIKVAGFKEDSITLAETGNPQKLNLVNAPGTKVYTSSDEGVARIIGNQIVPVSKGICTIMASVDGVVYTCQVKVKEANSSLFINYLETYHQYIKAHPDQFIRKYDSSLKSFETVQERVAAGKTVGITCVVPCRWALYELGVKRKDGNALLSCNNGTFKGQYTGGMVETFDWIKTGDVIGLSLKEAVDKGYIRKGDIMGFKGKTHTFVYSGNEYMVYEGGSSCLKNGHYPNGIMLDYGKGHYRLYECKISEIMRWKR